MTAVIFSVIPAKAGIQLLAFSLAPRSQLDSRFRGNDGEGAVE
jgi:hypothetical protein